MASSLNLKSLPCLVSCHLNQYSHPPVKNQKQKQKNSLSFQSSLGIVVAAVVATINEHPAVALTGENNYPEDVGWLWVQAGIVGFVYLIVAPPLIMNWLRTRWYKRNVVEMYFQFMFTFICFPGILVWAPFINVRKLPRDPSMKYPWSVPKDPSKIKSGYLKYPFAQPEDYTVD